MDAIASRLGEEFREAILSGEAQLSREEIRTLAGGDIEPVPPTGANTDGPVVAVLSATADAPQGQAAPAGFLEHRTLPGVECDRTAEMTALEEEPVDEELVEQAIDLVRKMNHPSRLAFVSQPLVLAAVRRLPRDLTTAA